VVRDRGGQRLAYVYFEETGAGVLFVSNATDEGAASLSNRPVGELAGVK
jgi:hypothetical protein